MGLLQYSVVVLIVAVLLTRIPGWFQKEKVIPPVTGTVAPGWEHVRDVYRKVFADGDDFGSSLGVYYKGELVVDLRGGFANEKELWPWQEDTITRIFSSSKGIGAICVALLVDRGLLEYTDPVVKYWPEFGVNGKDKITVEMLLSHQSGLSAISDASFHVWDEIGDIGRLENILAKQKPLWEPGTGIGYHALTIGLYMDQLVRHIDPKHRGIPQFFQEEIAQPFGIDLQFGLPNAEMYRSTSFHWIEFKLKFLAIPYVQSFIFKEIFSTKDPNVPDFSDILSQYSEEHMGMVFDKNREDVNQLWNPSVFAYTNARSLAKLYGILANGGAMGGKKLMSTKTLKSQTDVMKSGLDKVVKFYLHYGRGYTIVNSTKNTPMFGTPGAGGQMGYADPTFKLGIGYTSNYLSNTGLKDHRYILLEEAIYNCIKN